MVHSMAKDTVLGRRRRVEPAERLAAILESTADLNNMLGDTGRLYDTLLERLNAAVPFFSGSVQTLNDGVLSIVAFRGGLDPDVVMGLRFPLDPMFPNYRVVVHAASWTTSDIRLDFPHFLTRQEEFNSGHIRSWLGVPMVVGGVVIGMIALDRNEVDPFSAEEVRIVQGFANHAAVAIQNARVYAELQAALQAKDALMRELHHRVKNNMQLVSSLINLHDEMIADPDARRNMEELRLRVLSIAAVHERLYESAEVGAVDLGEYFVGMVEELRHAYVRPGAQVTFITTVESLAGDLRIAVPLGLILSEIVINAYKHAFVGRAEGTIELFLRSSGGVAELVVADDGVGMPDTAPTHAASGFGLQMIDGLAQQIGGGAQCVPVASGTRWEITFPLSAA